jgi:DNA-binding CsgD family transcriptional regulator
MSPILFHRKVSMTIPISGPSSTRPTPESPTHSIRPARRPAPEHDTVQLTESQQVQMLVQQGDSVSQIATSLSLSAAIVDSYLGIQAAVPAIPAAPVTQPPSTTISTSPTASLTKG